MKAVSNTTIGKLIVVAKIEKEEFWNNRFVTIFIKLSGIDLITFFASYITDLNHPIHTCFRASLEYKIQI